MSIVTDTRPGQLGRSDWRPLNLPFGLGVSPDTPAEQFSAGSLPWDTLDAECIFANRDGMGFMLELMPSPARTIA